MVTSFRKNSHTWRIWAIIAVAIFGSAGGKLTAGEKRVLHFPKDRSLGRIVVQDVNIRRQIHNFTFWNDGASWNEAEYLGEAQGDVAIPADKKVGLMVNKDAVRDLSPLLNLKSDDLYMLSLRTQPAMNGCMQYITHLTGLRELDLYGTNIANAGMKGITKLQSLERLDPPKSITDRGLYYIGQLASLKRLYIGETRATNAGLGHLSRLTFLEELSLTGEHIDDAGLVHLADFSSLYYLMLNGKSFSDSGLAYLKNIPSLKILCLFRTSTTDAGVRHLSGHAGLENIAFLHTQLTDRGLAYLKSIPSLKKLNIYKESRITDRGMAHLGQINSLESLDLPDISDKGVASIAKLKNLKHLHIYGGSSSNITDTALQHLSKLQFLEELLLPGEKFTNAGMNDLAKLTNLRYLKFSSDLITNEGLASLKALKLLEELHFNGKNVTLSGLSHLNALKNMSSLRVGGIQQDNSGMDISGLTKLGRFGLKLKVTRKEKQLFYDLVRDEDLACLKNLKNLRWLQISYAQHSVITDTGVSHLKDLTNMEALTIGSPYLTDRSLSYLTNMKKLNSLNVTGNFTDNGLRDLEGKKALNNLWICSSNNLSSKAVQQLKNDLPNIYSFTVEQNRKFTKMPNTKPNSSVNNRIAPSFAFKTLAGKDIKLEDYRGKVVMLYFWATWCKPCVAGTPELKKTYTELKASFGNDFELISLSLDNNDRIVRQHVNKYGLIWPQVRIGRLSKISSDYGVNDTAPNYFLIGPDSKILLAPESPQVDTKSFIEKVLKNRNI